MKWHKQLIVLIVLTLCSAWHASGLAHDNPTVEELLKVLRINGQITEQQYQELQGKADASDSSQASPTSPARAKVDYKPGRGFQFESADGKHTLAIGGRLLTRWGYTDRDGGATGQSDESEFRIAAARLVLRGQAFSPKLRYFFQTEMLNGDVSLLDAIFHYQYQPWLGVRLGQFWPGQSRQETTPIVALQFTERSIAHDFFNVGRDTGAELIGGLWEKRLHYRFGIFNGNGLNQRQRSTDYLYSGRLQFDPLGPFPAGEPEIDDLQHPRVSFGLSSQFNKVGKKDITRLNADNDALENIIIRPGFSGDNIDIWTSTADAAFKWRGFSLVSEYYFGNITTDRAFDFGSGSPNRTFDAHGWYGQAGYFLIPHHLEAAFRYSFVNPNNNALDFTLRDEIRGALNYYFYNQNIKLQTDIGTISTARKKRRARDEFEARIQLQLVF